MHEVDSQSKDRRALRAEYCIVDFVGIPHNTAIQVEIHLFETTLHWCIPLTTFHKRRTLNRDAFAISQLLWHGHLWNRASHYIFVLWFLLFSSSFLSPILSGRKLDVYHCGLSANLECRFEICCTRFAENTGRKDRQKLAIWASSHNILSGCVFATKACIDNRKKNLLNGIISSTCPRKIWRTSAH